MGLHPPGSTAGNVKFRFKGVGYEACVEVLRRGFVMDMRYTLEKDGHLLASVLPLVFAAYVIKEILY